MALKDIIDNITLEQLKEVASECSLKELDDAFLETDDIEKNMFLIDNGVNLGQNDDYRYQFFGSILINQGIAEENERFFIYNHKDNIDLLGDLFFNLQGNDQIIEKYYHFLENLGIHNYPQELLEELVADAPLSYLEQFFEKHDANSVNLDKLTECSSRRKSSHFNLNRYINDLNSGVTREGIELLNLMLEKGLKVRKKDYLLLEAALLKEDISALEKLLELGVKFRQGKKIVNIMNFLLIQGKTKSIEYLLENNYLDLSQAKLTQGTNMYLYYFLKGENSHWNKNALKTLQLLVKYGLNVKDSSKYLLDNLSNSHFYFNQELIDYLFTIDVNQVGKKFNHNSPAGLYIKEKMNIIQEKDNIEALFDASEVQVKKKYKI